MKRRNSTLLPFIFCSMVIVSCHNVRQVQLPKVSNSIRMESVTVDASLGLLIKYTNVSTDSIVFAKGYMQNTIEIIGPGVTRSNVAVYKATIPESDFNALTKKQKKLTVQNLCRPYTSKPEFVIIGPGDDVQIPYTYTELGYTGFVPNSAYVISVDTYISDEMKRYCPATWTGQVKGSFDLNIP